MLSIFDRGADATLNIDARLCTCKHPAFVHIDAQPDSVRLVPLDPDLGRCVSCNASIKDGGCTGFVEQEAGR